LTTFTSNNAALDEKYVQLISYRLPRFRVVKHNPFKANFRCPFCGDSQKSKTKARGYAYEKDRTIWFSCRNCTKTTNIPALIKHVDPFVYSEYLKEKYVGAKSTRVAAYNEEEKATQDFRAAFDALPSVCDLNVSHSARDFLNRRRIPVDRQSELKYCDAFFRFSNDLVPGKFPKSLLKSDEARIIIPVFDRKGNLTAYQGRALGAAKSKYIMIALDRTVPHVYGEDKVNRSKPMYVVEGPFDSMFLPNAFAAMNSDLSSAISNIGLTPDDDVVLIFDNEPRNPQIAKVMRKAIDAEWKVVIWPSDIAQKDINDCILSGADPKELVEIFDRRAYSGLRANMEMGRWAR
jgi:transcription elongation factor Elf1